uniref:G protein pathway suppressor 2-like n=1 Tax=Myxine glutinosa TaxID=7769 RepID=UPI00358ECFB8
MPALLERPKMTKTMAVALHKHVMRERERKRQEEEEADKIMEQKLKEEQQRRKKKEEEERMSLEETSEQPLPLSVPSKPRPAVSSSLVLDGFPRAISPLGQHKNICKLEGKLASLQQEKHQLFLQLKKVLNEEDKRRAKIKEQNELAALSQQPYASSLQMHPSSHLIVHGSHIATGRSHGLLGDRPKSQLYSPTAIPARAYASPGFPSAQADPSAFPTSQAGHAYSSSQAQRVFTQSQQTQAYSTANQPIRATASSAFQAFPPFVSHQQPVYSVHGQFAPQPGTHDGGNKQLWISPCTWKVLKPEVSLVMEEMLVFCFSMFQTPLHPLHAQSIHAGQQLLQPAQLHVPLQASKTAMVPYPHQTRPTSPNAFPHGTASQHTSPAPTTHQRTGFQQAGQQPTRHHYIQHGQPHQYYK